MIRSTLALLTPLFITFYAYSQADVTVRTSIERVKRDVYILASDSLGGRQFPQEGREKAAQYIANEFQRIGLIPIDSSNESYFQKIPAEKTDRGVTRAYLNENWIRSGKEFSFASTSELNDSLTQPIKFYGRSLSPSLVCSDTIIHISDRTVELALQRIRDMAMDSGRQTFAVSLPSLRRIHHAFIGREAQSERFRYPRGVLGMGATEPKWLHTHLNNLPDSLSIFVFNEELSNSIYSKPIKQVEKDLKASRRKSNMDNSSIAELSYTSSFRIQYMQQLDDNVIGYIEGSDLRDEVIVIGGHYDHMGKHGDDIFNGADDNASGTAGVMELARLCAQAKENGYEFRRSLIFIAFGAEESGLNGSYYYVSNPFFPLEQTVLLINMDMIGRPNTAGGAPAYAYMIPKKGKKRPIKQIIKSIDRQIDDMYIVHRQSGMDRLSWHFGSDHYPFIQKGVPALVVNTGSHNDYHKPTDTPNKINYENMINIIKALFVLTTEVANNPKRFPLR